MRYLPDSSLLIRFGRGDRREVEWMQTMLNSTDEVASCPITIAEVLAGAKPDERPGWRELFNTLLFWPVLPDDALHAGAWQYDLARRGIQVGLPDTLIAAVALRVGATVVTHNAKDFRYLEVPLLEF